MGKLANFLAFQIGWWACILSAADGRPVIGIGVAAVLVSAHLALVRSRGEVLLILTAGVVGLVLDGALAARGLLVFDELDAPFLGPLPLWMAALWMNFAISLNHVMAWMRGRYLIGVLFGVLGGPSTYFAGERLGALSLGPDLVESLVGIGIVWAVAMPALLFATERLLPRPETGELDD